tara:strand:- start:397 stop:618 length:222 start_codon:yes stop_codon:yes gene_type:complete
MCFFKTPKPKVIPAPAPVAPPKSDTKPAEISRKPKEMAKKDGTKRRRGSQRAGLVIPPSGVNKPAGGGTGVYS